MKFEKKTWKKTRRKTMEICFQNNALCACSKEAAFFKGKYWKICLKIQTRLNSFEDFEDKKMLQ